MVVFSVRFRLSELLVVDAALARKACLELGELLREDFVRVLAEGRVPTSMRLGREVRAAGFEGLLVPSARDPADTNLVIFPDRLRVAEAAPEKARVLERLAREAMRLLHPGGQAA